MATATQQPKITFLPPGPHRPELETQQHICVGSRLPISTTFTADGETESTGIDYESYSRMSTISHKLNSGRQLETPKWANNDIQLAKVLAQYMENRALISYGGRGVPGTPSERIQRAQAIIKSRLPEKIGILDGLCKQYVELKNSPANTYRRQHELEGAIEGLDTFVRTSQKDGGLLLAVGCVQAYFREGLTSVECAERLHVKPPHVRAVIFRLCKAAEKVKTEVRLTMRINLLRGLNTNPVAVPGKHQRQCWVCGCLFYPAAKGQHAGGMCSALCKKKRVQQVEKAKKEGLQPPKKYFCGSTCKDTARFAVKSLPVPVKPGVGLFVPIAGGDRYQNYLKFCMVIGTPPLTEEQWGMGCGPGSINKGIKHGPQF